MNTRRFWAVMAALVPAVALAQSAASSWRDVSAALTWQNPPATSSADDMMSWADAQTYCANLSLTGLDDWRLPSVGELRSLIRDTTTTEPSGSCGVRADCLSSSCRNAGCDGSDSAGTSCRWPDALTGRCHTYWTGSANSAASSRAWLVTFYDGSINDGDVSDYNYVRCVSPSAPN